jgi:hypothetical protein
MKVSRKLIEEIKTSKLNANGKTEKNTAVKFEFPWEGYNSRIVYEDKVYFSSLKKAQLKEIIKLKKELMDKVVFNGEKFAVQKALTHIQFEFVVICDQKRIGRDAKIL